jgi:hypothetical protein
MFPVSFHTFVIFAYKVLCMCSSEVQKILQNYSTLCCIFCASGGKVYLLPCFDSVKY